MQLGNEKARVGCSGLGNVLKDVDETAIQRKVFHDVRLVAVQLSWEKAQFHPR